MSLLYSLKQPRTSLAFVLTVLLFTVALAAPAPAVEVRVDCSKKNSTITAALATLSKQGPNTIRVSGACSEYIVIDGYQDLTLLANPGASLSDSTPTVPHDNDVVAITGSRNITVQGFTINGGDSGLSCGYFSICNLRDLTIKDSTNIAVFFHTSSGYIDNTIIQNATNAGLAITTRSWVMFRSGHFEGGPATIENNGAIGIQVGDSSDLILTGATVKGHTSHGVMVRWGSTLHVNDSFITGNGGNGVNAGPSAIVRMSGATITGNSSFGVSLSHLSMLQLMNPGGDLINSNAQPDINCKVQTAKTEGTGGAGKENFGGTTNCVEPAP